MQNTYIATEKAVENIHSVSITDFEMNWKRRTKKEMSMGIIKPMALFICFLLLVTTTYAETTPDKTPNADEHHSGFHLKVGERLFNGLIPMGTSDRSCISCHSVLQGDTVNFNPSMAEVAAKAQLHDFNGFKSLFGNDAETVLAKTHNTFTPDSLQLVQMHLFLKSIDTTKPLAVKPSINTILWLALLILIAVIALVDLIFTKVIPYKPIHILAILFSVAFITKTAAHSAIDLGRSKDYEPDQPIKFSHQVHAGNLKIDCFYCHTTADNGKSAGIPSTNVCMNCHTIVREGALSGKSEIAKLVEYDEKEIPIEWIRIHQLPDHVYFSHAQHVKSGKLECRECHGDIENMHRVKQVNDLSMGWCLDCHKTHEIDVTGNNYYAEFKQLHDDLKTGKIDKMTPDQMGANDCMKCHY
jgi:hypothetical protein